MKWNDWNAYSQSGILMVLNWMWPFGMSEVSFSAITCVVLIYYENNIDLFLKTWIFFWTDGNVCSIPFAYCILKIRWTRLWIWVNIQIQYNLVACEYVCRKTWKERNKANEISCIRLQYTYTWYPWWWDVKECVFRAIRC